jgi:hypothetical protein
MDQNVPIENGDQAFEVSGAQGFQEGIDDGAILRTLGVRGHAHALHAALSTADELSCRVGSAANDRADLVEGNVEHVMAGESETLGGSEAIEEDE